MNENLFSVSENAIKEADIMMLDLNSFHLMWNIDLLNLHKF